MSLQNTSGVCQNPGVTRGVLQCDLLAVALGGAVPECAAQSCVALRQSLTRPEAWLLIYKMGIAKGFTAQGNSL